MLYLNSKDARNRLMGSWRLPVVSILLLLALIFLQYRLWFQPDGIRDMTRLKKNLALQITENEALKKRNQELLFQIERMRNSSDATESRARNELGMIKKGETFYQIVR